MTIRQVVEIISNYAGSALPEPARTRVRNFILGLPQRWANANSAEGSSTGPTVSSSHSEGFATSVSTREEIKGRRRPRGSRQSSSSSTTITAVSKVMPAIPSRGPEHHQDGLHEADQEAQAQMHMNASVRRILTLATESLDMLHNVTNIFAQSLERAEA